MLFGKEPDFGVSWGLLLAVGCPQASHLTAQLSFYTKQHSCDFPEG